ncbi:MAG: EAL domain-containing protein [Hyphomonadaceae bacterium]
MTAASQKSAAKTVAAKTSAPASTLPSVDRRVQQQVRRDLLIFAGFIAAGFILSVNLDVVGILYGWANEFRHLQLSKLLGTIIVASVGLTLYIITRYHSHVRELRSRLQTEERARRVAMHDQLTGLPNRRHLKGVLNWLLSENDGAKRLAVVMLNLDKFGAFNDAHGRAVGDEMLMNVGKVLNLRAGVDGFVARLESDEFVVLLPNQAEEELMDWLSATLTAIEAPLETGDKTVTVSATAGAAVGLADGRDAETLLHRSSLALRRAKEANRGWFAFFKSGMDELVRQRALFESDLWAAVREDQIAPHFQPLVSLQDGRVRGYEILARWTHPTRGPIPPDQFIPAAEASGAICDLTFNLLRKACKEAATLDSALHLSLNVSPVQLEEPEFAQKLLKVLEDAAFDPSRLEIELTEAALVTDLAAARDVVDALQKKGVRVALDNFGTGHASLTQLRQLPFDMLKIDRSFVRAMSADAEAAIMVRTIISMAKSLSLTVVAEGVETAEQARTLAGLGCDMAQGYYFGRAAAVAEARRRAATAKADAAKPAVAVDLVAAPAAD